MARFGILSPLIQLMARWSSDAILRFVAEVPLDSHTEVYRRASPQKSFTNCWRWLVDAGGNPAGNWNHQGRLPSGVRFLPPGTNACQSPPVVYDRCVLRLKEIKFHRVT